MGKVVTLDLGDHFSAVVDEQVALGRYRDKNDVVQAALRMLEEHEVRLAALRGALVEGEESGASTPFDFDAFVDGKREIKHTA